MAASVLRRALILSPEQISLDGRFPYPSGPAADQLGAVVGAFGVGYNKGLSEPSGPLDLSEIDLDLRGFGYEGAAMSRTLLDLLSPTGGRRLRGLAEAQGGQYIHLLHVGAGWAFARLRLRPWTAIRFALPLFGWLAWDGWGFHDAYFRHRRVFVDHATGLARASQPIRDQGAGRGLWFYAGADPARIGQVIASFPAERRPDLWAGIGLAAAYTGALEPGGLAELLAAGDAFRPHLAQGAAFAAKARQLAGWIPPGCAAGIELLTGVTSDEAAAWTDAALARVVGGPDTPAGYQAWRAAIRRQWSLRMGEVSR